MDQRLGLAELWRSSAERLVETMALAGTPERALMFLQAHLLQEFRNTVRVDPLVGEAVRALMPWQPVNKVLQRTLRFQGFLALAQAGARATGRRGADGVAGLAIATKLTLLVLFKTGRHAAP